MGVSGMSYRLRPMTQVCWPLSLSPNGGKGRRLAISFILIGLCIVLPVNRACGDDAADGSTPDSQQSAATEEPTTDSTEAAAGEQQPTKSETAQEPASIDDLPWELRPYRVLISVGLSDRRVMNDAFAKRLLESLERSIAGEIGPYWQATVEFNQWLFPQTAEQLRRTTSESLGERFQSADYDKLLCVVLEPDGPLLRVSGYEWDRSTASRGPVLVRDIVDRRRAAAVTFGLLLELFRPLARIDLAEEEFAELRVRGGELLSPQSSVFPFRTGDLLTGHFRYLDRSGQVRRIQPVPWTYLRIDGITRSRMTAVIETAFASPLAGSRRRVELVALRVQPGYPETTLSLRPRTNPNQPLVGVRVRVFEQLLTEENPQPEWIDLMTDRSGTVTVPAYPQAPLRRMIVHSGGAVLSNVPFVPGVEETLRVELPDDAPRLQVEGNLAMVQGDLIDLVSRRAVMLSRAVALAKRGEFEESDRLLAEVDAQPSIGSFRSRILAIRVPAVEQAKTNRDRAQEKRILTMCRDLEDLVQKYLDRVPVQETKEEVDELKKLAAS